MTTGDIEIGEIMSKNAKSKKIDTPLPREARPLVYNPEELKFSDDESGSEPEPTIFINPTDDEDEDMEVVPNGVVEEEEEEEDKIDHQVDLLLQKDEDDIDSNAQPSVDDSGDESDDEDEEDSTDDESSEEAMEDQTDPTVYDAECIVGKNAFKKLNNSL